MRKTLLIICIFFAYLKATAQPEAALLKAADSLNNLKKFDAAITIYSKILNQKPQSEKALIGRGLAYASTNKLALAEKDFKETIRLNPGCADCHIKLGRVKLFQDNYAAALSSAEKALELDNKSAAAWVLKGRISFEQKKYADASSSFNKAIVLDSNNADAYYFRATVFIEMEMIESALNDLSMVIKLTPGNPGAYYETGAIYANQKKWDAAIKYFKLSMEKDSLNVESYKALGRVYIDKQDYFNAIKYFTKAIRLDDKDAEAYMYRGEINYNLEDMDASCRDYKAALLRLTQGKDADTKNYITSRIAEFCDSTKADFYYQRGIANYNLNQFDKAVEWYDKGSAKFPQHFMLTSFRAAALLKMDQYDKAEADYTKALTLKGKIDEEASSSNNFKEATAEQKQGYIMHSIAEVYQHRAEARIGLNNYAGAMADIDEGLKILPAGTDERGDFYYTKGYVYQAQQDNNNALSWFNKAIQADPKNTDALVERAIVKVNLGYKISVINSEIFTQVGGSSVSNIRQLQQSRTNIIKDNIESALSDCNKAIAIDPAYAHAFYIRGIVKMSLDQPDYCYDILKSIQLGFTAAKPVAEELKCE